jgi:GNAT superfamily N-acetyltransferase
MGYTIRVAEWNDRAVAVGIGIEFAKTTVARDVDEAVFWQTFDKCMMEGLVLVAEDVGSVVGVCGGFFSEAPLMGGLVFHEVAWYVKPEHRGCGLMLLNDMEKLAHGGGAVGVVMVAYNNPQQRLVEAVYRRKGYAEMESHWFRRF